MKKIELVNLRKKLAEKLVYSFDPGNLDSSPTPAQLDIIKSDIPVNFVIGSNRCLVKGTKVATPKGPVAIESLRPGDYVYSEKGTPIQVVELYDQGKQEVYDITQYGKTWATCTDNHVWLTTTNKGRVSEQTTKEITKLRKRAYYTINRVEVEAPLGDKNVPYAYALGALLGDGCCTSGSANRVIISSDSVTIPNKVAEQLGCNVYKCHTDNYSWALRTNVSEFKYIEKWCSKKKAHEKVVDMEEVKTWNRQSVLNLLAGILDTDGSVYVQPDGVIVSVGMQAKSVIDFVQWAFLALWQYDIPRHLDSRDKYKNGDIHYVILKNRYMCKRALLELSPYVQLKRKRWLPEYDTKGTGKFNPENIGVKKTNKRVEHCYDIHVNSPTNLYLLANGLVTHNSGKSSLGARIVTWWFNNFHPYKERPKEWGDRPIKILMMGQDTRNIQFEIFEGKIKPFIGVEGKDYKVKRDGGNVSAITNLHNGNLIIFMSHSDAEQARRRGQGFTADIVWLDEMPSISSIVTELILRIVTTGGFMYTTFTPLIRNDEIRKIVDNSDNVKMKKWLISILDNPSLSEEKRAELIDYFRNISGSEAEFRARMYGDWLAAEQLVFKYSMERNRMELDNYDPQVWPHVVVVDPAASGIVGLTVWARHPNADTWWCVKAKYLNGSAFSELVQTVEKEIQPFNVIKRVCDCNPSGFYHEAFLQDIKYIPVSDKNNNKENMIDACNKALLEESVYLTSGAQTLIDELTVCSRHEDDPAKIIKASKYHTADCFRYFIHTKPKYVGPEQAIANDERVRYNWKQRLAEEGKGMKKAQVKIARRQVRRGRR